MIFKNFLPFLIENNKSNNFKKEYFDQLMSLDYNKSIDILFIDCCKYKYDELAFYMIKKKLINVDELITKTIQNNDIDIFKIIFKYKKGLLFDDIINIILENKSNDIAEFLLFTNLITHRSKKRLIKYF